MYTINDFNTFAMNVNSLIEITKREHLKDGKYKIEEFDLRTPNHDAIYPLQIDSTDIWEMWGDVKTAHVEYLENGGESAFFFDVYWNDTTNNCAHFVDKTLWVYFNGESITYSIV